MKSFTKKLSAILLVILTLQIRAIFSQYIASHFTRNLTFPHAQPGDSIKWVIVRDYEHPITREPQFFRVEQIHAVITEVTARDNRRNFPNGPLRIIMRNLQARRDDEAGHLVAATLGGVGGWYNLVPQHRSVNRNFNAYINGPQFFSQWFNTENAVRDFLNNNRGGVVIWNVRVNYGEDLNNRRPTSFDLDVTCLMPSGHVAGSAEALYCNTFGNIRNDLPRRGRQW